MVLIPVLTVWWTHRRSAQKEYRILAGSIIVVCLAFLAYGHFQRMICTRYDGPLAAVGIFTVQLPLSVFVTSLLSAIPVTWKFTRNFVAIVMGEILLLDTWIS